jgi:hypothetical protein
MEPEEVLQRWPGGARRQVLLRNSRMMRSFDPEGRLEAEWGVDASLKRHGESRHFHTNGVLVHCTHYVHGRESGVAYQYDEAGILIGRYELWGGTGVDLWYSARGVLSEERHYYRGLIHGPVRWWNADNATIYQEEEYDNGQEHGIFRQWSTSGRMCGGFPKFYIRGVSVNARAYRRAAAQDHTLRQYHASENDPHRDLPAGFTADPIE